MFILSAGAPGSLAQGTLEAMAADGTGPAPRLWREPAGRGGAAAALPLLLPEDVAGEQPLVEAGLVLVGRVRLDNREELIDRLGLARPGESPISDARLLLRAFRAWDRACTAELVGDYAFVAWEPGRMRLTAAVDPHGMARLYWAVADGGLLLSGDLAALLRHPAVPAALDFPALARVLDSGLDRSLTPYRRVRALPGGHLLAWNGGEPWVERWWRPETRPLTRYRDPGDYVECIAERLGRAVAAQLRATTPIASTLSGGLDSGLVTSMAAKRLGEAGLGLLAYTAVPEPGLACRERPGWEADDGGYAAEVAARYGNIAHLRVSPGLRCPLDLLPGVYARTCAPLKHGSNLPWIDRIMRASVAAGARVMLVGQMGNQTVSFSGQGAVAEGLGRLRPLQAWALARAEAAEGGASAWRRLAQAALGPGLAALRTLRGGPGWAPNRFLGDPYRRLREPPGGLFALRPGTREHWVESVLTPLATWRPDPIAHWGLEWRDPTADRRVVEALLSFPLAAFRAGGRARGLARELGAGLLPESVRLRRTRGSQLPELAALVQRHPGAYRAALAAVAAVPGCLDLLDVAAMARDLEALLAGTGDPDAALELDAALAVGLFLAGSGWPAQLPANRFPAD